MPSSEDVSGSARLARCVKVLIRVTHPRYASTLTGGLLVRGLYGFGKNDLQFASHKTTSMRSQWKDGFRVSSIHVLSIVGRRTSGRSVICIATWVS